MDVMCTMQREENPTIQEVTKLNTVSPLHMNLQAANFQRYERVFACPITLIHVPDVHCHVRASSTSGCASVYKLKLDLQEDDSIELLAVQHEALTNENLMELEAQRKDEERQEEEEVTEEPQRFTMQEMARGFSLFEEALLVFEAQDQPKRRKVHERCSSHSECNPVLPFHL